MNIVFTQHKSTFLDTGLGESAFAKRAHGLNFSEEGMTARFSLFDNNIQFENWSFSGTTVNEKTCHVCFEKDRIFGTPAQEILSAKDESKTARMVFAIIKTITRAIGNKIKLSSVGLGGILYKEKISKTDSPSYQIELTFLPENLFELSASNQNEKDYSLLQGFWQNKALTNNNALIYMQSVIAYYSLAGIFPFMKTNLENRQEDIIDSNFIGIENLVNGINKILAANINMGFHIDNQYEREKSLIPLDLLQEELGLKSDGSYKCPQRKTNISQEKFQKKAMHKEKSVNLKTARKRIIKRYSVTILCALAAVAFISNYAYKSYSESMTKPCAKNLTSFEAVQTFYSGFHQQDAALMQKVAKGSSPRKVIDMISNVYVTSTTRTAYEARNATLSPELWLTRPELMDYWIFGITDFTIDGEKAHNRYSPITKGEFLALKKSGNINHFAEGENKTHIAKYNMIYTSGFTTPITVDQCTSTLTCVYKNDQWYITDISIEHNETEFSQEKFRDDFKEAYLKTKNSKDTVKLLREKYSWLPDDRAMDDAAKIADYQKNYFN